MTFEQFVDNCKGPEPRPHKPAFRMESVEPGWRIFDGDRAIAHVMPTAVDIWSFSPFEPEIMANKKRETKVLDVHTVHNTWINLGGQGWPQKWLAAMAAGGFKWEWTKTSGAQIEGVATLSGPDGEQGTWRMRVVYDESWGRYRYTWEIEAKRLEPTGLEPFNMLVTHALADRAATRRWTHSISPNADGEVTRVVHSNALFLSHGFWATRNTSYPRSWVAYAAHPQFNPTVIVHRSNVPMSYATCDQLFDQHVIWNTGGSDNLEADGYFHFRMSVELANLKPSAAMTLLETAREPSHVQPRRSAGTNRVALPFRWDEVNSLAKPVDPWEPEDCPIFIIDPARWAGIDWDQTVGRSDTSSIRLTTRVNTDRREAMPIGAVFNVKPHTKYRCEGWIKTKDVPRYARLELASIEYTYANVIDQATSGGVSGTNDWTRVDVTLDSGEEAYVIPKLVLYGGGTAWFDDLVLKEVK